MKESSLTVPVTGAALLGWAFALWRWPAATGGASLAAALLVALVYTWAFRRHAHVKNTAPNWYDGRLYASLVEAQLAGIHTYMLRKFLQHTASPSRLKLLDVGCGTGAFAEMAVSNDAVDSVVGIDSSKPQVDMCRERAERVAGVKFEQANAVDMPFADGEFDGAFLCMVLHEMAPKVRSEVVQEAVRVAKRVVLCDFESPMPLNLSGLRNRLMEFTAGPRHCGGFIDFQRRGGLSAIARDAADAAIVFDRLIDGGTVRVTILEKQL